MKILYTHYCDLDGIAPIILSQYFELGIDKFVPAQYGKEKNENSEFILSSYANKENDLIITDFGISQELYNYVKEHFRSYLIFDHHENSLLLPEDDSNIFVNMKQSGTLLFYKWIQNKINKRIPVIIDDFVNIVNTYDTWQKDSSLWNEAENLNRVLWKCIDFYSPEDWGKFQLFIDIQLQKLIQGGKWRWTTYEINLIQQGIEKEEREIKNALGNMKIRKDNKGHKFIMYHGSSKISQVCSKLLEKYEDVDYIININTYSGSMKKQVNGKVSLRSREGFDVTQLHNINGHKQAAGGEFKEKFLIDLWVGKIKNIPYVGERE